VSKNKKKGQVIKTLTLKRKVKHHYTKRNDGISIVNKKQNNFSFLFFANKSLLFFVSKMSIEKSFVEELHKQSRKRLYKFREEKQKRQIEEKIFSNILLL
jgi:hypothetical protein